MASVLRRAQEPGKARVVAIVAAQVVLAVLVVPAAQVVAVAVRAVVVVGAVRGEASEEEVAALAGAITSLLAFRC